MSFLRRKKEKKKELRCMNGTDGVVCILFAGIEDEERERRKLLLGISMRFYSFLVWGMGRKVVQLFVSCACMLSACF